MSTGTPHRRFGRLVVEAGLATREQVEACLAKVQETHDAGEPRTLGQVMLEEGLLTRQEILRVLRSQNKAVLQCGTCGRRYNIVNYRETEAYRCRFDDGELHLRLDDVDAQGEATGAELAQPGRPGGASSSGLGSTPGITVPPPWGSTSAEDLRRPSDPASASQMLRIGVESTFDIKKARTTEPAPSSGGPTTTHNFSPDDPGVARPVEPPAPLAVPDDADAIGHIGDYLLLQLLGRGGMGDVFLGRNPMLDGLFAIKILSQEKAKNTQYRERFMREARLANRLDHPNVVKVWDVGAVEGYFFIAMEYVEGETFSDWIKREGPLRLPDAVSVILQALRGIEAAHAAGIIHRDVKPGNLMVRRDGLVKVFDFGLALPTSPGEKKLTLQGQTFGTPHFMSPEQIYDRPVTYHTDIFSLGITLYHALTGTYPYTGEKAVDVLYKRMNEAPVPIQDHRPDLPDNFVVLLERMMGEMPSHRFTGAYETRKALEPFARGSGTWRIRIDGKRDS